LVCFIFCELDRTSGYIPAACRAKSSGEKKREKEEKAHTVKRQSGIIFYVKALDSIIYNECPGGRNCSSFCPKLQTGFCRKLDEGSIVLDYNSPPGTNLEETDRELKEVEKDNCIRSKWRLIQADRNTNGIFYNRTQQRAIILFSLKQKGNRSTEAGDRRHPQKGRDSQLNFALTLAR